MTNSLFDQTASKVAARMAARVPSMSAIAGNVGDSLVGKFVPKKLAAPFQHAIRGDIAGATNALANGLAGRLGDVAAKKAGKLGLLGGISLAEAARIAAEVQATQYSKKNLWFVEIGDWEVMSGYEDISHAFNLFATDVSYGPSTITSEGKNIGMAVMDAVSGTERTEIRITTYDDAHGTIRGWFDAKCDKVAHPDGTIGLPIEYLVRLRITQSATDEVGGTLFGSYKDTFVMRPTSVEYELSRSEDALQQIQMTFSQFDTFMPQGK